MSYYFAINGTDYSKYVNKLVVAKEHFYKGSTSPKGVGKAQYRYSKRVLEVGIIPLDSAVMAKLLTDIDQFSVTISYRDPKTNIMVENLRCIIPNNLVEYYTIQGNNVKYKAFSIQIQEL